MERIGGFLRRNIIEDMSPDRLNNIIAQPKSSHLGSHTSNRHPL